VGLGDRRQPGDAGASRARLIADALVIECRVHIDASVAAWLEGGSDAIFGAPPWVRKRRGPTEVREITA
jgi:hypothetical protein